MRTDESGKQARRILVVDHNPSVREGLCAFLSLVPGIEVIGQAVGIADAVRLASALHPDAILLDLDMPNDEGYRAGGLIGSELPECRLVALAVHGLEEERERALQAGFDFFVTKGAPLEALIEAILSAPARPNRGGTP